MSLPKVATAKRRAREAKKPAPKTAKTAAPSPQVRPAPARLKPPEADPLAVAAMEHVQRTCHHQHLQFQRYGAVLRCPDCQKRWFACVNDVLDLPDYMYGNPGLTEMETRHSPFVTPRLTKPDLAKRSLSK
jgi:hypothetical protein